LLLRSAEFRFSCSGELDRVRLGSNKEPPVLAVLLFLDAGSSPGTSGNVTEGKELYFADANNELMLPPKMPLLESV